MSLHGSINSWAEQSIQTKKQTVMGTTCSMLKAMNMSGWFWGEVVAMVVYLLNRSPIQCVQGQMPYEVWHGSKPSVHHLRTFGCVAHMKQGSKQLAKLEDCSTPMVFVGYEGGSKVWSFYGPHVKRVHVSCDAMFMEDRAWNLDHIEQGALGDDHDPV
jgi:hypothetical protein